MTPNPNPSPELREGEFLPCPFCGSGDPMFVQGSDDDGNWVAVVCPDCGVGSRQHYHVMEDAHPHAQNAWNTRALSPQALPAPGEVELREAYRVGFNDGADEDFNPDGFIARASPSLATVAAANDEGVARIIDPKAWEDRDGYMAMCGRVASWDSTADSLAKAAAIRLLLQEEGK